MVGGSSSVFCLKRDVAARIADKDGLGALTLTKLADELKVKSPSLYNHVGGLTELLDELTLLAVTQLLEKSRGSMPPPFGVCTDVG